MKPDHLHLLLLLLLLLRPLTIGNQVDEDGKHPADLIPSREGMEALFRDPSEGRKGCRGGMRKVRRSLPSLSPSPAILEIDAVRK